MTEADFRSSGSFVDRMREIFADPIFQAALITLKDSEADDDVALDSEPEIVSVRMLSRKAGYAACLARLFALATPLPQKPIQLEETWEAETPPS